MPAAEPGRSTEVTRADHLDAILAALLREAPGVEAAAVVSPDGLPMASALPARMDTDHVAAMSAALLALGDRAAAGLGRGDLTQVCVEGEHGTVVLVEAGPDAVLVAVSGPQARTGLVVWEVRRAAARVAEVLDVAPDRAAPAVTSDLPVPSWASAAGAGEPVTAALPVAPPPPQAWEPAVEVAALDEDLSWGTSAVGRPEQVVADDPQPVSAEPAYTEPVAIEPELVWPAPRTADWDSSAPVWPTLAPAAAPSPEPAPAAAPEVDAVWTAYEADWSALPPAADPTVLPGGLR